MESRGDWARRRGLGGCAAVIWVSLFTSVVLVLGVLLWFVWT